MKYETFLESKAQDDTYSGFEPLVMPGFLFDFQQSLVDWAVRKGKAAIFADCGLGKTPMQLVWAENIVRKTNGAVLILTPLAVAQQTVREGEKFGIEVRRSSDGKHGKGITVTNYEHLHKFDAADFDGVICDESSILKNFDGIRKAAITEFMRTRPYRLLCTATAAPNDYIELGTSAECLGMLGYMDMLNRFFKNDQNTSKPMIYRHKGQNFQAADDKAKWRFKRHAEQSFWRWVSSWARACRKPSDLGFDDGAFILPELIERETVLPVSRALAGELFIRPALSLQEQREERRMTISERCAKVAEMVSASDSAVVWCHLNPEGDLLEKLIPGAVQVSGADSDDEKEEKFMAFSSGEARVLITKPKIGAFGLNWQHCNHVTFFPSHSYEQYYQGVRRCWRFGQKRPVTVDIVTTEGEAEVMSNLQRKSKAAEVMFRELVSHMNDALYLQRTNPFTQTEEVPQWL